ncbi:hypothetical protein [Neptuniibacter sp.]|uniref:hypothetical protein n=1 Tax=Neptuniibacter sp. TaxID=1962643 RepID=UPI00261DC600|nr:hypothetical protein [Neptuniibacter sp.]MCP4597038.1 hypothetical protein [Neptuniibacter sp.]
MNGIKISEKALNRARLYTKKPLPVQAQQINQTFWVESLEGDFQGKEGDYLMRGVRGELYVCDKGIFEETYVLYNPPV